MFLSHKPLKGRAVVFGNSFAGEIRLEGIAAAPERSASLQSAREKVELRFSLPFPLTTMKRKLTGREKLLYAVALLMVPAGCVFVIAGGDTGSDDIGNPSVDKVEAWICAQHGVKNILKSPSTAEFPWGVSNEAVEHVSNYSYVVSSYVDAQNSFGAMIRTNFICWVDYDPIDESCKTQCELHER